MVNHRLDQLHALLDILNERREFNSGFAATDLRLREKISAIELAIAHYEAALKIERRIARMTIDSSEAA